MVNGQRRVMPGLGRRLMTGLGRFMVAGSAEPDMSLRREIHIHSTSPSNAMNPGSGSGGIVARPLL